MQHSAHDRYRALRAAQKRLEGLAKQSGVVRTQAWLPEVVADVHALRTESEEAGGSDGWRWGGGVSVQVPLFDRGQGRLHGVEARFDGGHGGHTGRRSATRRRRHRRWVAVRAVGPVPKHTLSF